MNREPSQFQEAELQDALGACDELFNVISRLKRLSLLTDEEDREIKERVDDITRTLKEKMPDDWDEES